jgi:hypothetical protein
LARAEGLPDPKLGAKMIRKHAPYAGLVVFETGPRATWLQRERTADGLKAVGIAARQAIRHSIRRQTRQTPTPPIGCLFSAPAGFFREVRGKSPAAMRAQAHPNNPKRLLTKASRVGPVGHEQRRRARREQDGESPEVSARVIGGSGPR